MGLIVRECVLVVEFFVERVRVVVGLVRRGGLVGIVGGGFGVEFCVWGGIKKVLDVWYDGIFCGWGGCVWWCGFGWGFVNF